MSHHQGSRSSRQTSSKVLKFAEYTALAASVAGTIVATASRQVVYAATPLTIALFLNLVNRQRFAQQIQHRLTEQLEEVEQTLSGLNQQITQLPQTLATELNQQIAHLETQLSATQTSQTEIASNLTQFETRLTEITQQFRSEIEAVHQQIQTQLNAPGFVDLQALRQSLGQLRERIGTVEVQMRQLQTQVATSETSSFAVVQQSIQQLFDRTTNLGNQFAALETQSIINALNATDLQALRQSLGQLREQIGTVEVQMRQLQTQVAISGQLQEQIDILEGNIQQLQSQITTSETSSFAVVQQSIQQLFDRTANLRDQFTALETQSIQPLLDRFSAFETDTLQPLLDRLSALENRGGAQVVEPPSPPPPGLEELDLNLGIDFGTTYTKVCFRDIGRDVSEVVTFTDGQTDLETALLPTKIGILPDGTLIAGLTATEWQEYESRIETAVEFIKMRLADLDLPQHTEGWRLEQLPELDQPETVENLCAYYLSRVISRSQSWIRRCKPNLIANQQIVWSANVGVPVAYCDSPAIERFERVLSLAWLLSNQPQTEWFTLETLAHQMDQLRSRLEEPIDCFAVPEIAAEAWAFFDSREADDGFYIFFDIGDGTLDGTAFYYYKEDGEPKVDFYAAKVDPLGVTALSQQIAKELKQSAQEVKAVIQGKQSDSGIHIHSSESRRALQRFVAKIIQDSKQNLFQKFPNGWLPGVARPVFRESLKIFVGGGGSKTAFYPETITSVHSEFDLLAAGIAPFLLKPIPTPEDLEMNQLDKQEFHRFAVAYGLSIPKYEGAEARLPRQVTDAQGSEIGVPIASPPLRYEDGKDFD